MADAEDFFFSYMAINSDNEKFHLKSWKIAIDLVEEDQA